MQAKSDYKYLKNVDVGQGSEGREDHDLIASSLVVLFAFSFLSVFPPIVMNQSDIDTVIDSFHTVYCQL